MFIILKKMTAFISKLIHPLFIAAILVLLSNHILQKYLPKQEIIINRENHSINLNSSILYFNGGLRRFISSVLWVHTLMLSDTQHYKKADLNSWMYLRFSIIQKLDPHFLELYHFGGQYLSIIKDDLRGATEIFELGLKEYPYNYFLNYHAAFLYFHELKNYNKAIPLLQRIQSYPQAPVFIPLLISTLMKHDKVDDSIIINYLKDSIKDVSNLEIKDSIELKIKNLSKKI